jgi:hypothetical protein
MQQSESREAARLRLGLMVLVGLAVLTGLEFWASVSLHSNVIPYLAVVALLKAGLIARYFMHIAQLWHTGEGHP